MQIALAVYPELTALDIVGPYQVLSRLPGADVAFVAAETGPVADDLGLVSFPVHRSLVDTLRPDVVVVPGGLITRRLARDGHPLVAWLRRVHPTTQFTTSVCTGSLLLGAAGILDGLDATSHWSALERLEPYGASPTLERVVERGRVITSAGVSSGIDMALVLAARLAGDHVAQTVQLAIEYDPQPPFTAGSPLTAPAAVVEGLRADLRRREAETLAA